MDFDWKMGIVGNSSALFLLGFLLRIWLKINTVLSDGGISEVIESKS